MCARQAVIAGLNGDPSRISPLRSSAHKQLCLIVWLLPGEALPKSQKRVLGGDASWLASSALRAFYPHRLSSLDDLGGRRRR